MITARRLDLSQSDSSPLNETDEKCVTARRSARLQSTPNAFYGDRVVSASSEDDSDFDNESQSPSDSDSSDGCLSGDDNTPGVNTPLRRTYNISAAALETPKVKKAVAEISAGTLKIMSECRMTPQVLYDHLNCVDFWDQIVLPDAHQILIT